VTVDAEGGPFVLCRVREAAASTGRLAARGLWVRDCTSFGLPQHLRLGVRAKSELQQLILALSDPQELHR
jgi:histidinol-phosphate/aromatic aminotransferase/cobyric acid decarboxylase-like protein